MSEDRTRRGIRDLILSMAVVGLFVAFLFAVVWRPSPDPIRTVDPAPMLQMARAQADFPVLAPADLPAAWRATSARFRADEGSSTWFLGYVTPEGEYVAVTQTDGEQEAFIAEQTLQGEPDGERTIAGRQWQQYVTDDQRSLVRSTDTSTTVVTGTVSYEQLQDFAGRLAA
ncbi:MAG: DUF4245 domain-containing protein [Candidatus Nanopelagicales bacterium]